MPRAPSSPKVPERIGWAVAQMQLRATDSVLEVGAGGGQALTLILGEVKRGPVVAIDRSAAQVAAARARHREALRSGRLRIEQLSLERAPDALAERFSKVLAVNVNAFWTSPDAPLASLRSLLRVNGHAYLVFEPPSAARARSLEARLPALLRERGFRIERTVTGVLSRSAVLCVVAGPGLSNAARRSEGGP